MESEIKSAPILVVDDNSANLDLLRDVLEMEGYTAITTIQDPFVAERTIMETNPALVILDIRMPGLDGIEILQALRQACTAKGDYPSVLVMTAQKDSETKHQALAAGARDFITKPFDGPELLHRVHNLVETRLLYDLRKNSEADLANQVRARTKDLEMRAEELSRTQREIIRRLGRAGEYRDNETGNHVTRVGRISRLLAEQLGLEKNQVNVIEKTAPLHDLGKVGIPDSILLKPGPLTAEQWEIMKTHAEIGADLLSDFDTPVMISAQLIANYHHERWDGGGYPEGLKGREIPIEARIVAVADVFDALVSRRPYKEPWPESKAIAHLRANAGSQFDPDVIAAFLAVRDAINAVEIELQDYGLEPEMEAMA